MGNFYSYIHNLGKDLKLMETITQVFTNKDQKLSLFNVQYIAKF